MAVLNTTSPTVVPEAPIARPRNTVPSASASNAGVTGANSAEVAATLVSGAFMAAFVGRYGRAGGGSGRAKRVSHAQWTYKRGRPIATIDLPRLHLVNYTAIRFGRQTRRPLLQAGPGRPAPIMPTPCSVLPHELLRPRCTAVGRARLACVHRRSEHRRGEPRASGPHRGRDRRLPAGTRLAAGARAGSRRVSALLGP